MVLNLYLVTFNKLSGAAGKSHQIGTSKTRFYDKKNSLPNACKV